MNKIDNKAIEEMAKIMCAGCLENETLTCSYDINNMPCRWAKYFAHTLYNAGYCKVNEGDIVLTQEEYEKLKRFEYKVRCGVCFTQKEWFDYINEDSNERTSLLIEAKAQAHKETARAVANLAIQLSNQCLDFYEFQNKLFDLIKEMYGIEVETQTIVPAYKKYEGRIDERKETAIKCQEFIKKWVGNDEEGLGFLFDFEDFIAKEFGVEVE